MGVAISNWRLARTVSRLGQLGVVSGTALDQILARRLEDGDPGGHMRRAMDAFPFPAMAERVWKAHYLPGGKAPGAPYTRTPFHGLECPRPLAELGIVGNFVEVFLAREGHTNPVGINYLEKIQPPHLIAIYGAMLAGVGYVLMGAGIPLKIPGVLDAYVEHQPATYPLYVVGAQKGDDTALRFTPREFMERDLPPLVRPRFLPIIASNTLAVTMIKKANGRVDGFVVEGPTAGGHNAPPRGKPALSDRGEPVYGDRDKVDLAKLRDLGLPFWLAGGFGAAGGLQQALESGAAGVQVGTAFAYCAESGLRDDYRQALLEKVARGEGRVFTDPLASPSGFPFKVVQLEGSISERAVQLARRRVCDLGYLREAYRTPDGRIDFRCPSEPLSAYVAKGGRVEDTVGRTCICNALVTTAGAPQIRGQGRFVEAGIVTSGDDLTGLARFMRPGSTSYTAADVIRVILNGGESSL
ncbi:MAG: nitronate monooxygenase [Acidobacteriia bacterium]|nr:nitronate monooxygenase [Terriglobia bacterium]